VIRLLAAIDKWIVKIAEAFTVIAMIALTLIIFLQVIARYIFQSSLGAIDELPVILMMLAVWLTGISLSKNNTHIRLELFENTVKNKTVLRWTQFVMHLVTVVALVVFIYLSWKFVKFGLFTGDTTPGLKIPLWLLTSVLLVSGCLMCIHYFVNAIREMKETGK